jgi:hypothetical protein
MTQCHLKPSYLLSKQLYSGKIKVYKEINNGENYEGKNKYYVIKLSGIWESNEEVGLTYKLIEVNECYK